MRKKCNLKKLHCLPKAVINVDLTFEVHKLFITLFLARSVLLYKCIRQPEAVCIHFSNLEYHYAMHYLFECINGFKCF